MLGGLIWRHREGGDIARDCGVASERLELAIAVEGVAIEQH